MSEEIKVLIADDESWECEALEKMLHNLFPDVRVIPSVYNGVALVDTVKRERPDIVIVDINMPKLNGLDALETLRSKNIQMEIIIHTAYSKFDYIHKALKMGASDFLVKPVFEEDFSETFSCVLKNIEKKRKMLDRQRKLLPETVNTVLENNIMMSLLLHKPDEISWKLFSQEQGKKSGRGVIAAFHISFRKPDDRVFQVLVSSIRQHCDCLSILHQTSCYCYLLMDEKTDGENYQYQIKKWLLTTMHTLENDFELEIRAGISGFKEEFQQMPKAMEEAEISLKNEAERGISFYSVEKQILAENIFKHKSEQMAQYIQESNLDYAMREVQRLLLKHTHRQQVEFATCFYAVEMLMYTALLLEMDKRRTGMNWTLQEQLKRLIQNNDWEEHRQDVESLETNADVSLSYTQFLSYMQEAFLQLFEDLKKPVRKPTPYVEKALLYMEQNYMKDISLDSTAESIGITQFYLSRLLKQERNQTFPEILTNIRISKAIHLLLDQSRTVQNVSSMVGYNTKYFYQVFKSATGISQKEFRDRMFKKEE